MLVALIPPPDVLMCELEQIAIEHRMHLITDGKRLVVSPIVPPGWHRMGVTHKSAPLAPEVPQCAA
jgi:hypothetical protein